MVGPGLDHRPGIPGSLVLALGGLLVGCFGGGEHSVEGGALRVAVSVPPLADVVEAIGGDEVDVVIALPPGTDPHAVEISPRRAAALDEARLAVTVDSPAFPWEEILSRSEARVGLGATSSRAESSETESNEPHRWLDLAAMEGIVDPLVEALAELDPGNEDRYRVRGRQFRDRLVTLRADVDDVLAPWRGAVYFVDHAVWSPLTRPRGLVERALATGHREATPGTLARRIDEAREIDATTLFVRPGRLSGAAESFLRATNARPVVLDPLARPWEKTIRVAARSIAEALGER